MDADTYLIEAKIEEKHWWFVGRRKLIASIIHGLRIPYDSYILDVGVSSGTNLRLLNGLGYKNFCGVDINKEAIELCTQKGLGHVCAGDICNLPYKDNQFHLVLATDILEHVDDDIKALSEIKRVLHNSGYAIITVPAFKFLWGIQDNVGHHKRRYGRKELETKLKYVGMQCLENFYFNYLLFLPILFTRKLIQLFKFKLKSENQINTAMINWMFSNIFSFDIWSAQLIKPPVGVSQMIVAKKM